MRLIKPSYEIIEQGPGLQGIYDIIERCGKISYKSEPKGGEVAKRFVEARTKERHGAVLEFGTVYLKIPVQDPLSFNGEEYNWEAVEASEFYDWNQYSRVRMAPDSNSAEYYITTNYRVLVENNRLDDLKYLCEPTEYHEKRYAVKFITDIGLGRDFLRHRVMSMVQESTRYVNYAKEKFGEELTFVIPPWIEKGVLKENDHVYKNGDTWYRGKCGWQEEVLPASYCGKRIDIWLSALGACETAYLNLVNDWDEMEGPWQPQQARGVLPLATKTEFVLCGFTDAWIHFFRLRSDIAATGKAHPMSIQLANPLRDEFIERKYITKENLEHDLFEPFDVAISDRVLKD